MRYRKLRIAWSATCLIACVLLIALWVRSKDWTDQAYIPVGQSTIALTSMPNEILIMWMSNQPALFTTVSIPATDWVAAQAMYSGKQSSTYPAFFISFNTLGMRHWCGVLLAATFAALPWLSLLPCRFSLRTLLIATTLVAVVLGLIVWAAT